MGVRVAYEENQPYEALLDGLAQCDYYLYCGMDEGSLGTLDALKVGVRTIVTDQGFHRDLGPAIDHLFCNYEDLRAIIAPLVENRITRLAAVDATSWRNYAIRHVAIWEHFIKEGVCPARPLQPAKPPNPVSGSMRMAWRNKSFFRYYGLLGLRSRLRKRLKSWV
jgi:hypothetical protein